jgi:hypothetical protein
MQIHAESHRVKWSHAKSCGIRQSHENAPRVMQSQAESGRVRQSQAESHRVMQGHFGSHWVTQSHAESRRVMRSHAESSRVKQSHAESRRVTWSHGELRRVVKSYVESCGVTWSQYMKSIHEVMQIKAKSCTVMESYTESHLVTQSHPKWLGITEINRVHQITFKFLWVYLSTFDKNHVMWHHGISRHMSCLHLLVTVYPFLLLWGWAFCSFWEIRYEHRNRMYTQKYCMSHSTYTNFKSLLLGHH